MTFNGIALGTVAALVIYHGLSWVAEKRGTQETPPTSPAMVEADVVAANAARTAATPKPTAKPRSSKK
jgi:hypothetical protein